MAKAEVKKVAKAQDAPKAPDAPAEPKAPKKDKPAVQPLDLSKPQREVIREARLAARDGNRSHAQKTAAKVAIAVAMADSDDAEVLDRADAADAAEKLAADAVAELEKVKDKLSKSRDKVEQLQQEIEALKAKYESADKLAEREESAQRLATFEAVVASLQGYGERVDSLASMLMAQSTAASATTAAVRELPAQVVAAMPPAPTPVDPLAAIQELRADITGVIEALGVRLGAGIGALETASMAADARAVMAGRVESMAKQVEEMAALVRGSATMSAAAVAILAKHVVKIDGVVADASVAELVDKAKAALA